MTNELMLILAMLISFAGVLIFYKGLGKTGLYIWVAVATISANIEVALLVDAFGINQTLGNILFATTFLTTDILSELYGKESAKQAVKIGIFTSIAFIIVSQSWLLYIPSGDTVMQDAMKTVFGNTPRVMLAGLVVYAIVQSLDVVLYHSIWKWTKNKTQSDKKYLWLRNNGATMLSQLLNAILFNLFAFYGVLPTEVIVEIIISTYIISFMLSLLDTPVIYLARNMYQKIEQNKK